MKWYAISGSWRITSSKIERDVRNAVAKIIKNGDGIVSGGALNVDYFATDEAMILNPNYSQIRVFIPTTLKIFGEHYRKRACEGVISQEQAELLIVQLTKLKKKNKSALIENTNNSVLNKLTYFDRNTDVVNASDELLAFQVNNSEGVQDTIDKAKKHGKKIKVKKYYF